MRKLDRTLIVQHLKIEMEYMSNLMENLTEEELLNLTIILNRMKLKRDSVLIDFREGLAISYTGWTEWNSGGGCMIWSLDYNLMGKIYSLHVSDECFTLSNKTTEEYWGIDDYLDQTKTEEIGTVFFKDHIDIAFLLCPLFGQEIADRLAKDINEIAANL